MTISPPNSPIGLIGDLFGGASSCSGGARASGVPSGGSDPLSAVFALTQDVDALASSGLGAMTGLLGQGGTGTLASLLGGGGQAGSIAGMLA